MAELIDTIESRATEVRPNAREFPASEQYNTLQFFILPEDGEFNALRQRRALFDNQNDGYAVSDTIDRQTSLDSYLNSFYEKYWTKYTNIRRITICIKGSGRFWCSVRRVHLDGASCTVRHDIIDLGAEGAEDLDIELTTGFEAGRLFAEFGALGQPFVLDHVAWCTAAIPERRVVVGLALCTFNRENLLIETLNRITKAPGSGAIAKVIVVNQGNTFESTVPRQMEIEGNGRLELIQQENFGGAGGFTRGAMELLKDQTITHILFMDDDIEVDAAHITTASAFAAYAADELVVGGQMLDLFKPTLMFEAGTRITSANELSANHRDLDLRQYRALQALSSVAACDFNAWWFCLVPAMAFARVGLPTPVFIRGDDQEFGIRLGRAGFSTISLPPVSVWHEPFYAKQSVWQLYYDLRNRLIFASLYPDRVQLDGAIPLLKRLMIMLIKYDYQQVRSIVMALEDFCRGPAVLDERAPLIHARVINGLGRYKARAAPMPVQAPLADEEYPQGALARKQRLLASLLRALSGVPRSNRAGQRCQVFATMPLNLMRLGRSYVLTDDGHHFALEFRYSMKRTWIDGVAAAVAIARYCFHRRRASSDWKAAMPTLSSAESWAVRFGIAPGSYK